MFVKIDNININYKVSGKGKTIILLHGWGGSIDSFALVHRNLEEKFKTYSIDLPGFGKSNSPNEPWGTKNYANIIEQFLKEFKIDNPILIGHSFGGRIAIYLAAANKINKLILINSAGIIPKRTFNYYLKVGTYKLIKRFFKLPILNYYSENILELFRKKAGSEDYQNTSGIMRATLIKVVNEDLKSLLHNIKSPTLLIWGENDQSTPISDGKLMEKLIPGSGLIILKNTGHFSYLEKINEFLLIINNFLINDMEGKSV